jgi:cell division protein FtsX
LCFASFGSRIGVVRLFSRPPTSYSGVYLHKIAWGELPKQLLELLAGRWGNDAQLTTRYWLMPVEQGTGGILLSRADGAEPVKVRGVCGLDQEELERRPDLAKLLGGNPVLAGKIFMTVSVADYLGVKPGDTVLLRGQELVVGAMLDAGEVAVTEDMDGSNILPVDFTLMVSTQPGQTQQSAIEALESTGAVEEQNWAYLPVDSVVFVSADTARQIGGTLRAVTLYTDGAEQAAATAEEMARILPFPVIATRPDGVYRHVLGSVVQASGARDLFFPIVLGALVIFGTMLGSVADREREIYTFSALGLAPAHVASLFLAEAMAYSVIGGMSGYLLAQVLMKLFSLLASLGLMAVPEMNYSSTNAIVTLLIVMGTVLLSAIYPALKASRSANPGILRTWRLPPPTGDTFDLVFPFTVSEYDITGVASFLKEHFGNYADTGLGSFMARDVRLVKNAEESVGLDAFLALAPFDLGVTEAFQLRSAPSEIAGIDEVKIRIVRQSGQYKDWQRLNKVLLNELRRQFLIWRSLPHETMEFYRRQTLEELREIESETAARANQE